MKSVHFLKPHFIATLSPKPAQLLSNLDSLPGTSCSLHYMFPVSQCRNSRVCSRLAVLSIATLIASRTMTR